MSITLYFKIVLIYSKGKYEFEITEIQADLFKLHLEKSDMIELNTVYSIPNDKTWIYVKHEYTFSKDNEIEEENIRKRKLLLFKTKNKLINYENSILNERVDKLNNLQYKLKQGFDNNN